MLTPEDKNNAFWNTLAFVISSLLNFLNYSLIYKTFDLNVFGFFILISSIFGIGANLDFGFGISTIKNIAEAKKTRDVNFINSYFTTYLLVFITTSIIIATVLFLYSIFILKNSEFMGNDKIKDIDLNLIIMLMAISFIFNYVNGYLKCTLEGFSEYVKLSQINIICVLFNTILYVFIILFNLNIYHLTAFITLVSLFSFILTFYYIFLRKKLVVFNFNLYDFKLVKRFSLYGINIQLSSFVGSLVDVLIKYLIGLYLSLPWVSYFESGKKIINFSNGIIFSTQRGILVKLSEENILGNLKLFVNRNLYYFSKMSNYYSILIYGIANPFICWFILFWFKSYESMQIYLIFSMSYAYINFGGCMYAVLMVEGIGMKLLLIQAINFILTYAMLVISLNVFNNVIGLLGYYISTLISMVIIFYSLYKTHGFDYKKYLKSTEAYNIILLNVLIFIQIFLIIILKEKLNYILAVTLLVFFSVFYRQFKFIAKMFIGKLRTYIYINR